MSPAYRVILPYFTNFFSSSPMAGIVVEVGEGEKAIRVLEKLKFSSSQWKNPLQIKGVCCSQKKTKWDQADTQNLRGSREICPP